MSDWQVKSAKKIGDRISIILEPTPAEGIGGAAVGFILGMWFMHLFGLAGIGWGLVMWLLGIVIASFFFWPALITAGIVMAVFLL